MLFDQTILYVDEKAKGSLGVFESGTQDVWVAGLASLTPFSRRELFIWLASILCATAASQIAMQGAESLKFLTYSHSLEDISRFEGFSAFEGLGWFAVLRLLILERSATPVTKQDFWAIGILGAINLMPAQRVVWIAASLAAVYIYVSNQKGSNGRAAASVLGAICVLSLWGPTLFSFFSVEILRADATLVGFVLDMTQSGFVWHDNVILTQGHSLEIYTPCSSFHNVSLAALCWIALTKLHRPTFIKSDFLFGVTGCLAMIALNATRLYLMALSHEKFAYWHDGFGAEIFAVGSSLIIVTIFLWGVSVDATRHE
jgi:hypothetical protein